MAKCWDGDDRGMLKASSVSSLPPRFPTLPPRVTPSPDSGTGIYNYQSGGSATKGHRRQYQGTPSCNIAVQDQPPWLDELLDDSKPSNSGKGSHRRSASDSFTYLGSSGNLYTSSNIVEEDESECVDVAPQPVQRVASLDGACSHQLTNLWEEIQQLQNQQKAPVSSRISQPLRCRNIPPFVQGKTRSSLEGVRGQPVSRREPVWLDDGGYPCQDNSAGNADAIDDFKPAKRQSAQRSRVRKLQYIAELERTVNALQAEISALSPQILYFDHQRALLNMDNNTLKQQIAVYAREKNLKDFQNEMLKKDVQRLQKLYELQLLRQEQVQQQAIQEKPAQLQHLQRYLSLPTDLGIQAHGHNESYVDDLQAETLPSLSGLMKDFDKISLMASSGTKNEEEQLDIGNGTNESGCSQFHASLKA